MRKYTKFNEAVALLNNGWEIFTTRGCGPSNPLYFDLYKYDKCRKRLHRQTVEKLIRDKIIYGKEVHDTEKRFLKYKLITI